MATSLTRPVADPLDRPSTHRSTSRGRFRGDQASVPGSARAFGRFGRMFGNLPSFGYDDARLDELARRMTDGETGDSAALPAGLTYLGQFVDHDLTFDTASSLERQNDPHALLSFRTPGFDLDCLYGRGPDDQPYLYEADRTRFRLGASDPSPTARTDGATRPEPDLPRLGGTALNGDPRNDENLLVAQVHLAFLLLHNRLANGLEGRGQVDLRPHRWADGSTFREAQRLARWHYQWVVLTELLPAVCGPDVLGRYVHEGPLGDGRTCRRIAGLGHDRPGPRRRRAAAPGPLTADPPLSRCGSPGPIHETCLRSTDDGGFDTCLGLPHPTDRSWCPTPGPIPG
jgi:hypothetical protein